jgi:hypothetical protein
MRTLTILAIAGLLLGSAGLAYADLEDNATCHVYVDVNANIGVMPIDPHFDLGGIQTGIFSGIIPFRVDANTEQVMLSAAATHLYKGDDPDSLWVDPIELYMGFDEFENPAGIDIIPEHGSPIGDHSVRCAYTQGYALDGFIGMQTESVIFESAQNNHFSQTVDLVVTWDQVDPEKPMGEYSGFVALFAWIVLPS